MSPILLHDETADPWDGDGQPARCLECGAELNGSEDFEDVCMDCDSLDGPDYDDMELDA